MPTVTLKRRHNPDHISDQVDGRYPLRLVRYCIKELWAFIESPGTTIFGGGSGSPGSGGGPAADLATRVMVEWRANGPYRVDDAVDGAWVVPTACEIRSLWLWRGTAGRSGQTAVDLKRRPQGSDPGTESSLFVIVAPPSLAYNDPDGMTPCNLPDVVSLAQGDILTVDCTEKDAGRPYDFALTLEAA